MPQGTLEYEVDSVGKLGSGLGVLVIEAARPCGC